MKNSLYKIFCIHTKFLLVFIFFPAFLVYTHTHMQTYSIRIYTITHTHTQTFNLHKNKKADLRELKERKESSIANSSY